MFNYSPEIGDTVTFDNKVGKIIHLYKFNRNIILFIKSQTGNTYLRGNINEK